MKKVLLILVGTMFSLITYSQIPLVKYKPVTVQKNNNSGNSTIKMQDVPLYSTPITPQQQTNQQGFKVIGAYFYDTDSKSFKRTKIKINLTETYFGEIEIYLRGVLDRSSYRESWRDCNNRASKVNALFDTDIIVDNFEWKVEHSPVGAIYFNY